MGLLTKLYNAGLLGGRPKRLLDLQEEGLQAEAAGKTRLAEFMQQPAWEEPGKGTETVPTDVKRLGGYGAAGDIPAAGYEPGKKGKTFEELSQIGDIMKKFPIDQLVASKAGPQLMQFFMSLMHGPEAAEQATEGTMFPTEKGREAEEYRALRGLEGLEDDYADILYGIKKPIEQPRAGVMGAGAGLGMMAGPEAGKILKEPSAVSGKETADIQRYNTWKTSLPENYPKEGPGSGTSYGDYKIWEWTNKAKSEAAGILGKEDPDKRRAMNAAQTSVKIWAGERWLDTGKAPSEEEISGQLIYRYFENLKSFKAGKQGEDILSDIRKRLEENRRKKGE